MTSVILALLARGEDNLSLRRWKKCFTSEEIGEVAAVSLVSSISGGSRISHRGRRPRGGALTPKAVMFRKFFMPKRKNLDPWGVGRAPATPPDPPMLIILTYGVCSSPDFVTQNTFVMQYGFKNQLNACMKYNSCLATATSLCYVITLHHYVMSFCKMT